jgi:crotonobetainyl-CoA:carnitine CoA-transferase CaiB-like acyl-CoA transferase
MSTSTKNKRWALEGVRVVDLTWLLAGPGGTRILASLGAEVIRVEWRDPRALDFLRYTGPFPRNPTGTAANQGVLEGNPAANGINRSGNFNNINTGKLGISLNLNHPKGREILKQLVAHSHVLCENYSPDQMDRWGLGYGALSAINPKLIYVQTTGMGKSGVYKDYSSYGPTAQALSGLTHLSGLPEPAMPAGWGYSYLDHSPGYYSSMLIMAALIQGRRSGGGCYIDLSQTEVGLMTSGTSTVEAQITGQPSRRYGNRMPYADWAPHGAFPTLGDDEWIAIAVQTEAHWGALVIEMGAPEWAHEERFRTAAARKANEDDLDRLTAGFTRTQERYDLMNRLQKRGVPSGVVQKPADRFERDRQLRAREYYVPLRHSEIGEWPIEGFPARLSASPAHVGGLPQRAAPCLGEDNERVYGGILGLGAVELAALREEDVI